MIELKSKCSSIKTILDNMREDHISEFSAQCALAIGAVILVFGTPIISTIQEKFGLLENYNIISKILTQILYFLNI